MTLLINWKRSVTTYSRFTCYVHLRCSSYSYLFCLDWREICDGKIDCIDAEDKHNCFELEMNQCSENEYQCRNRMYVDKAFLLDDVFDLRNPECLDGSDEATVTMYDACNDFIMFAYEDTLCQYPQQLTCGDGTIFHSVLPRIRLDCKNRCDIIFNYCFNWNNINDTRFPHCFKMLLCASDLLVLNNFNKYCEYLCQNTTECRI